MFPENFRTLHDEEESLRSKSIAAIEASPDLLAHAKMVERSMDHGSEVRLTPCPY